MIPRYPDGDPTSVLRLEVEDPDAPGLTNKIPNPSGDLGAWGWITPRPGQYLVSKPWAPYGNALYLRSATVADNLVRTISRPVTAGRWIAGAWTVLFLDSNAACRARITFLNAAGAVVSSTAWVTKTATGRHSIPAVQVPATAIDAYLTIEMGNGAAYPLTYGGYLLAFRDVAMVEADTSGDFGISRTNLFTDDPSFESALSPRWEVTGGATMARDTGLGIHGSASLVFTATAWGAANDRILFRWNAPTGSPIVVNRGEDYTLSVSALVDNDAQPLDVRATLELTDGALLSLGAIGKDRRANAGGAIRLSRVFTVPLDPAEGTTTVGVARIYWQLRGANVVAGDWHAIDGLQLESGAAAGDFIVGTQVTTDLSNLAPMAFRNIIAPALDLTIVRDELDVSTLTAEVVSAALDPATSPLIRPRRVARVRAYVSGAWETIFTGTMETAKATYDPLVVEPERRARVALMAVGNEAPLARTPQPDAVATAAEVPHLLEGAGVPWDVDGSPNSAASVSVVLTNENASALDQVALVRDSIHGYAWVDRHGVLRFRSGLPALGEELNPYARFSDATDVAKYASVYGALTAVADADPARSPYHAQFAKDASAGPFMLTTYGQSAPDRMPAMGGQTYTIAWDTKATTGARKTRVAPVWYDATGNILAPEPAYEWDQYVPNSTSAWATFSEEYVAPPGTVGVAIAVGVLATDFDPATETAATPIPAGEVHLFDNLSIKATAGIRALTPETVNPNIVVDYDMERVINIVTIKRPFLDSNGEAREDVYGPYTEPTSVTEFGPRPTEFVVVGLDSIDAQAWAEEILAKNAHPTRSLRSATVPIDYDGATGPLLATDLYDALTYTDDDLGLDSSLRVVGLTHRITSEGHLLDLVFAGEDTVAAPQAPPALPSGAPAGVPTLIMVKNGNQTMTSGAYTTVTNWTATTESDGWGIGSGIVTPPRPGLYLVAASLSFDPDADGQRVARVLRNGSEIVLQGEDSHSEPSSSASVYIEVTGLVVVQQGDNFRLQGFHDSAAAVVAESGARTRFHLYRLGD